MLGFASFVLISRMIELVNQKLPESRQIEYAYRYPGKIARIRLLYRELYPGGRLADWEIRIEIAGALWLTIATAILFWNAK